MVGTHDEHDELAGLMEGAELGEHGQDWEGQVCRVFVENWDDEQLCVVRTNSRAIFFLQLWNGLRDWLASA